MNVSCIVLCTFNDLFVRERLIPSIVANSDMSSTEIIVVDNSPGQELQFDGAQVVRSQPYHIPKGYNRGVAAATGRYVALFHDDCLLEDPGWVEASTGRLSDSIWAVGPDLRTRPSYAYLKEVPLVMERANFLALGGYDESRYLGYQADLLCIAIEERGKRIARVDFPSTHFCGLGKSVGMSTLLMLSGADERDELRHAFAAPSFSLADMQQLVGRFKNQMRTRYFFHYLLVDPLEIHIHERYPGVPSDQVPSTDRFVKSGVLVKMMPGSPEEMERLLLVLSYYNELFERVTRISAEAS